MLPSPKPVPYGYLPLDGLSDSQSLVNMLHLLSPQHLLLTNHNLTDLDLSRFNPSLVTDSPIPISIPNDILDVKNFSFPDSIVVKGE